jgi:hypothetical protein
MDLPLLLLLDEGHCVPNMSRNDGDLGHSQPPSQPFISQTTYRIVRLPACMPEAQHETGREGVMRVRRLLEGTMRFRLPYDAYSSGPRASLPMLVPGQTKQYDLQGNFFDDDDSPGPQIYIEVKSVKDAGSQANEFKAFLAQAYSATVRAHKDLHADPENNFMWATTCPWKGAGFREVASRDAVTTAIEGAGPQILPPGHEVDAQTVDALLDRFWVWVVSDRQEEMTLGRMMRSWVAAKREEAK